MTLNVIYQTPTHKIESVGTLTQPAQDRIITQLKYRQRFTFNEKVAIETAAETDAQLRVLLKDTEAATFIDLDDAEALAGLMLLESKGLITEARRLEILNNPVLDTERPN